MKRRGTISYGLCALAAGIAVTSVCALASPASANPEGPQAQAPKWHVVYHQPGAQIVAISSTGPRNAWAIGARYGTHRVTGLLLHWNGSAWRSWSYPDERTYLPEEIFALSPADFWLFGPTGTPAPLALHWKAGHWSTLTLPVNAAPMVVLGDENIWVAGGNTTGVCPVSSRTCTAVSRWNGTSWTTYSFGVAHVVSAAATAPHDIWAVGEGDQDSFHPYARPMLFHWTGSVWKPASLTGRPTTGSPSIVVDSPHDIFVGEATPAHPGACAMHWSGSKWTPLYLPGSRGACGWLTTDYHGGFWLIGQQPVPGITFTHWTGRHFVPTSAYAGLGWGLSSEFWPSAIPGSRSLWLYGWYCPPANSCPYHGLIAMLR